MDLHTTIGITIIRITLGLLFTKFGYLKLVTMREHYLKFFVWIHKKYGWLLLWFIGLIELIGGLFLILGLFTTAIAIIFSILMFMAIVAKKLNPAILKNDIDFYILLFAVSLSLIFLGSGLFNINFG